MEDNTNGSQTILNYKPCLGAPILSSKGEGHFEEGKLQGHGTCISVLHGWKYEGTFQNHKSPALHSKVSRSLELRVCSSRFQWVQRSDRRSCGSFECWRSKQDLQDCRVVGFSTSIMSPQCRSPKQVALGAVRLL